MKAVLPRDFSVARDPKAKYTRNLLIIGQAADHASSFIVVVARSLSDLYVVWGT
jgi:hypothetical protein